MARRLLVPITVLFLVLLVLGSLGPDDALREDTVTTPAPRPPSGTPARTVEATLPADDDVRAHVGDIVSLTVESDTVGGVELPDFGESEPVAPSSPAHFDVLPTEPGRYPVLTAATGEEIGALVVEARD